MRIGVVRGSVWATKKHPSMGTERLLIVEPLRGFSRDDHIVAVDSVDAGAGDTVIIAEGSAVQKARANTSRMTDALIVAIVDEIKGANSD